MAEALLGKGMWRHQLCGTEARWKIMDTPTLPLYAKILMITSYYADAAGNLALALTDLFSGRTQD